MTIEDWAEQGPDDGPTDDESWAEFKARIARLRAAMAEAQERFRCPACGKPGALANGGDRFHPSTCKPNESKGE